MATMKFIKKKKKKKKQHHADQHSTKPVNLQL